MKIFLRILLILSCLLALGIGVLIWIGMEIREQQESWAWHGPRPAPANPRIPELPDFTKNDERPAKPTFSHKHGYYDERFTLTLAGPEGAAIWYTEDGSVPLPDNRFGGPHGRQYTEPVEIIGTSRITAISVGPAERVSIPVTQTYLFLADILKQSPQSAQAAGWPLRPENGKRMDYGMDPRIVEAYSAEEWQEAFGQIATLSISTSQGSLTDSIYGIYANPTGQGKGWERYASAELIDPQGGEGFQTGCGLRIRGGFTRNPFFPKHSFRMFFRKKYGNGKLKYPLFGEEGADRFDKLDLRTAQNYSWARERSRHQGTHNTFVREVFCRDTQRDLGSAYTRSRYYHLFLNGQYWGIYMSEERPEAAYGATYFEGDRAEFDTLKCSNFLGGYELEATDGDLDAWRELWEGGRRLAKSPSDEVYAALSGLTPDLRSRSGAGALVEVDNLIQYMLIHFYAGNSDGPLSAFLRNRKSNNWFAIRNRNGTDGFRFFVHDAEHTLGAPESASDRTGPFRSRNQDDFRYSNPQWLHQDLMAHAAYRARFAVLAKQHLTGDGALTTAQCIARFRNRADQIRFAMRAQAARWGDAARPQDPYQVEDWEQRIDWVIEQVITGREHEVIEQLKEDGLY